MWTQRKQYLHYSNSQTFPTCEQVHKWYSDSNPSTSGHRCRPKYTSVCLCMHHCVLDGSRISCLEASVIVTPAHSIFLLPIHLGRFILFACRRPRSGWLMGHISLSLPSAKGWCLMHTYTSQYKNAYTTKTKSIMVLLNAILVKTHLRHDRGQNFNILCVCVF